MRQRPEGTNMKSASEENGGEKYVRSVDAGRCVWSHIMGSFRVFSVEQHD